MSVLKEVKRDAMYRSMKYWGKKPHNIWAKLIERNTQKKDIVMDPFAGTGVSFFESILLDRKPLINDTNPLTTFIVDVYSHKYNYKKINEHFLYLEKLIKSNDIYKANFYTQCENCNKKTQIYNYRFENNIPLQIAYKCEECNKTLVVDLKKEPEFIKYPDNNIPEYKLSDINSISSQSIEKLGGDEFKFLWTSINANILSLIFKEIKKFDEPYKKIFTFAFIQTLHLTSKMCAIRGEKSNRVLSSSWGRPAFMALSRFMSQNPLIQLQRAFYGNSGIINSLKAIEKREIKYKYSTDVNNILSMDGIVLNKDSRNFEYPEVDFILTDPPYGNIIKYGELSLVWNLWLIKMYPNYNLNLEDEIIIDSKRDRGEYQNRMNAVFDNCYKSLKDDGNMIFTFNSQNKDDWTTLKQVIKNSEFKVSNFYLQENLRSSESNVSGNTSTSKSDYYIELSKERTLFSEINFEKLDNLILE